VSNWMRLRAYEPPQTTKRRRLAAYRRPFSAAPSQGVCDVAERTWRPSIKMRGPRESGRAHCDVTATRYPAKPS